MDPLSDTVRGDDAPAPEPGWLPVRLTSDADGAVVDWAHFGSARLMEPFYENAARAALWRPSPRLRTPAAALADWADALEAPAPDGFIFHLSRCGSTLVSQMLAQPARHIVISEAPPIDEALRTGDPALFRAMVRVFAHRRDAVAERCFIKLDSWHAPALPFIRRAFPRTPWVFVYRDPVEVMVSQMRRRGAGMVPPLVPPQTYGLDLHEVVPNEDYCAQVLAAVCEGALRGLDDGGGRLVNYTELPGAVFDQILPHFGAHCDAAERAAMQAVTGIDAKSPDRAFTPESAEKQQAATPALRALCERHIGPAYRALEARRAAQGAPGAALAQPGD